MCAGSFRRGRVRNYGAYAFATPSSDTDSVDDFGTPVTFATGDPAY